MMEKYSKLSKELADAMEDDDNELILKLLKKIYKIKDGMTYDILKKTKIGRNVGVNRKRGGDIEKYSTTIVDSWRHLAPGYKRPAEDATPKKSASPAPKKAKREPETLGELTTRLFKKYLEPKCDEDTHEPEDIAIAFGKAFEERYKDNEKAGRDMLTEIIQDLNDKDHEMRDNLMRGVWTITEVINGEVDITPTWIAEQKKAADKLLDDKIFIRTVDTNQETDTLECPKCHGFKAKFYEKQTRSADEPMTVFARCMLCGARWRK